MSSAQEQEIIFGDGQFDNVEITVATANTEIFFDFYNSGTDDATHFYYGFGRPARKVCFRPSANASITEINGKVPKYPITVTLDGWTSKEGIQIRNMKIKTGSATESVKVLGW